MDEKDQALKVAQMRKALDTTCRQINDELVMILSGVDVFRHTPESNLASYAAERATVAAWRIALLINKIQIGIGRSRKEL